MVPSRVMGCALSSRSTRQSGVDNHTCQLNLAVADSDFLQISKQPLAFAWRRFATPHECNELISRVEAARTDVAARGVESATDMPGFGYVWSMNGKVHARAKDSEELGEDASALVRRFDLVTSEFLQHEANQNDVMWQKVVNLTPAAADGEPRKLLRNGVHVDTHNNARPRFATALLYLRSPQEGGETLFASNSGAGARLLAHGAESSGVGASMLMHELAEELEASARPLVPPATGTLLLFFVRGGGGQVDPAGFHGSAVPIGGDKWTLQTFWAAPPGANVEAYARARRAHVGRASANANFA